MPRERLAATTSDEGRRARRAPEGHSLAPVPRADPRRLTGVQQQRALAGWQRSAGNRAVQRLFGLGDEEECPCKGIGGLLGSLGGAATGGAQGVGEGVGSGIGSALGGLFEPGPAELVARGARTIGKTIGGAPGEALAGTVADAGTQAVGTVWDALGGLGGAAVDRGEQVAGRGIGLGRQGARWPEERGEAVLQTAESVGERAYDWATGWL